MNYIAPLLLLASFVATSYGADVEFSTPTATTTGWLELQDCLDTAISVNVVPIDTCFQDSTSHYGGNAVKITGVWTWTVSGTTSAGDDVAAGNHIQYTVNKYFSSDCSDSSPISSVIHHAQLHSVTNTNACSDIEYLTGTGTLTSASEATGTGADWNAAAAAAIGSRLHKAKIHASNEGANALAALDDTGVTQVYYSDSSCTTFVGGNWYKKIR